MTNALRRHWGIVFLSLAAVSFLGIQAFFSANRDRKIPEVYFADRMSSSDFALVDEFNRLHEGEFKVVPIDFPNAEFTTNERKEILARSLRGEGEGVDVFAVDLIWVQRFERWAEPLDRYFSTAELEGLLPMALQTCYRDGKLAAVPFKFNLSILLYREDLLRGLPGGPQMAEEVRRGISWNRFIDFGRRLPGSRPYYVFPAADYEGLLCPFTEVVLGRDPGYFERHGFDFNTTSARRSLQFLVDLVRKWKVTPEAATAMTEVSSYEYFIAQEGLFLRGWTTYDRDFAGVPEQREVRMAPLPHFEDGKQASTVGGWNLMVSRFSSRKDQAVAFVKFLLERRSQERQFVEGGYFPVLRALYDSVAITRYPGLAEARRLLAHGVLRPSNDRYTRYSDILASYMSQAIRGRLEVVEALRRATEDIASDRALAVDHK